MRLFLGYLLIAGLLSGLAYFMLDAEDVAWKLAGWVIGIGVLIGRGFFMGIGIHLAIIVFGW